MTTSRHREIHFEDAICEHLASVGWIYEASAAAQYDRARALYAPDVVAWVRESQPQAWEALDADGRRKIEALKELRKALIPVAVTSKNDLREAA